jgi:hypothetical protein
MLIQCRASSHRVVAMSSPSRGRDGPCRSTARPPDARAFGVSPFPFAKVPLSIAKMKGSCQATRESPVRTHPLSDVVSSLALRDTFDGVGVGRKTGSEADEAIR